VTNPLEIVLVLLASTVGVVIVFRKLNLPALLGYLLVGVMVGPHALGWVQESDDVSRLAEFGVVFLMFSIGLEFSLHRLFEMRRIVFGLGLAQVTLTLAVAVLVSIATAYGWRVGLVLGAAMAMSSTAIVVRLMADRVQLDTPHGREIMGVLLLQDLAVVPLLVVIPVLSGSQEALPSVLGIALGKAALILLVLLFLGQKVMRRWFHVVARGRSHELFILNVLMITLGLAWLTERAGLSLALGAFLGGMLIAETEYRHQVEEDIKPFREVLMGLFFVTVGMLLDMRVVASHLTVVMVLFICPVIVKFIMIAGLSRLGGAAPGTSLRTGLGLAQFGEFGLVLVALAVDSTVLDSSLAQLVVAAILLSMFAAPVLFQYSDWLVMRFTRSEWMLRSLELHRIAAQSLSNEKHVIICGYGRTGQRLAHLIEQEGIGYVALDPDPERVSGAVVAGEGVVFGDATRRETLIAAGILRASAMVITFADTNAALKILHHARSLHPSLPIIVRTIDDADLDQLIAAGAAEVVPETFESSLMLASHALVLLGVPLKRVVRRIRDVREDRYGLMRGFFHGGTDDVDESGESRGARLRSVPIHAGAYAIGRTLRQIDLEPLGVVVNILRRQDQRLTSPALDTTVLEGDVLVLRGSGEDLEKASMRLLQGVS
jgi:CPA2 family monovalent cation:H+ antiporter-2